MDKNRHHEVGDLAGRWRGSVHVSWDLTLTLPTVLQSSKTPLFSILTMSTTKSKIAFMAGVTTIGLCYYVYKVKLSVWRKDHRTVSSIIDNFGDDTPLAVSNLLNGNEHIDNTPGDSVEAEAELNSRLSELGDGSKRWGQVSMIGGPYEERRHRRLHKHTTNQYMKTLVAEIKVKVGTPEDKECNRQVVRRLARGFMEAHGLRPSHQAAIINTVIELVFTPGDDELKAIRLRNGDYVRWRKNQRVNSWWNWFFGIVSATRN